MGRGLDQWEVRLDMRGRETRAVRSWAGAILFNGDTLCNFVSIVMKCEMVKGFSRCNLVVGNWWDSINLFGWLGGLQVL